MSDEHEPIYPLPEWEIFDDGQDDRRRSVGERLFFICKELERNPEGWEYDLDPLREGSWTRVSGLPTTHDECDNFRLVPKLEPHSPAQRALEDNASGCDHCDSCGGVKTYANQACLPLHGRVRCIDWCIHHIIAALNAGGVETVASCCGHGQREGRIDLADGRILVVRGPDEISRRMAEADNRSIEP